MSLILTSTYVRTKDNIMCSRNFHLNKTFNFVELKDASVQVEYLRLPPSVNNIVQLDRRHLTNINSRRHDVTRILHFVEALLFNHTILEIVYLCKFYCGSCPTMSDLFIQFYCALSLNVTVDLFLITSFVHINLRLPTAYGR